MNRYGKRTLACVLAATVTMSMFWMPGNAAAAKKIKLNKTKVSLTVGNKEVVKLVNGSKKAKVTWKTSKKAVAKLGKKVTKGNKASVTVVAVKKGSAKITASYKLGGKVKKFTANVKVSDNQIQTESPVNSAAPTPSQAVATPTPNSATTVPTNTVTNAPTPTEVPTEAPTATPDLIKASNAAYFTSVPSGFKDKKDGVEYGSSQIIKYHSEKGNYEKDATVILPPNYDESKSYPVVYMMHGIAQWRGLFGDETNSSEVKGSIAVIACNLMAEEKCPEMIIVYPNVRTSSTRETDNPTGDNDVKTHSLENYQFYDDFIDDIQTSLMPYMEENFSIKTGRENTAIAGFSMGGRESLYIGFKHPELFGYIGAYCPAFGVLQYENKDVGMGEDGFFSEDDFTLSDEYKNNTFVEIVQGSNDTVVHEEPTRYHNVLVQNEFEHLFYVQSNGWHSDSTYDPGFYNFLLNVFKLNGEESN